MANFVKASHQSILKDAQENIDILKNQLIPQLKNRQTFSMADLKTFSTIFYNAGATINYLIDMSKNGECGPRMRVEASSLSKEYDSLCEEAISLMQE